MNFHQRTLLFDMLIPASILLGLLFIFHQGSLDITLAGHFFDAKKQWIYRDNYYLEQIFHKGGVKFIELLFSALVGYFLYSSYTKKNERFHEYVKFVLISSLLAIVLVFALKRISNLSCPWESMSFGGRFGFVPLWAFLSSHYPRAHCFPAGHSSGGYAFLSMYYGYSFVYGKRNVFSLLPGLLLGSVFGIIQQMRGAHFLSHDLATVLVSIFSSWLTYFVLRRCNDLYEK